MPVDILYVLTWAIMHGARCWAELHPAGWLEWLCRV